MLSILKSAFKGFGKDECGTRAAALAYYTIFALPPLLILLVTIAGKVWGPDAVQQAIEGQFSGMIGPSGAQQIHQMVAHGQNSPGRGTLATILGALGLILGATGAFLSLQDALNHAWEVKPDPNQGGVKNFIGKRLLSMGMVLGLGFLVAVSLALSAAISALGTSIGSMPQPVMYVIDLALSLVILGVLFSALFKFLPDAKIAWSDVWVGGLATAVLFIIGKFVIGLYLGHSKPGNTFGAASALAVILVWIYYAGMIVLFGAEFTQEWATQRGHGVAPKQGAVKVVEREERVGAAGGAGGAGGAEGMQPAFAAGQASSPDDRSSLVAHRSSRGGIGDWIVGLPVLYFLFRGRDRRVR